MTSGATPAVRGPGGEVVLGEIRTQLLDTAEPLPLHTVRTILELMPGRRPTWRSHPIMRAVSPNVTEGVDCDLTARRSAERPGQDPQDRRVRAIGTVCARVVLTGGHVVQGSVFTKVLTDVSQRRERWSHYSSRPGVVEVIRRAGPEEIARGYLEGRPDAGLLDLESVGRRVVARVSNDQLLDHGVRLRSSPTRLRWAAELVPELSRPAVRVRITEDRTFHVALRTRPEQLEQSIAYCEVVALHDWLLTALKEVFEQVGSADNPVDAISPALDYLVPLWNPAAHLDPEVRYLWRALEEIPQLSWEWTTVVGRIRDRMSLLTLRALETNILKGVPW